MIIKPTATVQTVPSTDILTGLSCRFEIASPQQTPIPLHNYKIDLYQGVKSLPVWIQHLNLLLKSGIHDPWEVWAKIPLGHSPNLRYGYIDLMAYLGIPRLDLSGVSLGLQAEYMQGGDSVLVLIGTEKAPTASTVPDDFLP